MTEADIRTIKFLIGFCLYMSLFLGVGVYGMWKLIFEPWNEDLKIRYRVLNKRKGM